MKLWVLWEYFEGVTLLTTALSIGIQIFISQPLHLPWSSTDTTQDRNIILALTYEYRAPPPETIKKAVEESGNPSTPVSWNSRYVGLVVVPGAHVKKIEFEESGYGKSNVVL